ncbi:hypothetical protein STANM309S_06195 [Streptomyces tanashiensis]
MLQRLSADDPRFKTATFTRGMNLVVADTTTGSSDTDSRNSAGKSSLIELIHFLLGARADKRSLTARKALCDITFCLEMDWPDVGDLKVWRSGSQPGVVRIDPGIGEPDDDVIFALDSPSELTVERWTRLIERDLFNYGRTTWESADEQCCRSWLDGYLHTTGASARV